MRSTMFRPCVVCGSSERRPVLTLEPEWRVARCTGCGMHTLAPEPDEVRLEEFEDGSGYEAAEDFHDGIVARYQRSLAGVERFVRPGRLLDVGCGTGVLLEAARARGWDATGVDPSPYGVERARAMGFEAHAGMIEDIPLTAGSFDAVTLLQVVEHVTDPRPLLDACRRLLRPGGALLVATPNPAGVLARAKRERFNYWIPPIHCVWYTPGALGRLLRHEGFAPVRSLTWSPRVFGLHDGIDLLDQTRLGGRLPWRVKRLAGEVVVRAVDALGRGSMVEQVALRWGDG